MGSTSTQVSNTQARPSRVPPGSPYATFVQHGPIGFAPTQRKSGSARSHVPAPAPSPAPVASLTGLSVGRGARRRTPNDTFFVSTQIDDQDVIIRAQTRPDRWSVWSQIVWDCDGGRRVSGYGNGWSIPRSDIRTYRISATLGRTRATITIAVVKRVSGKLVSSDGTPIHPRGGGRMINIYGEGETDSVKFEDYAIEKQYQVAVYNHNKLRPLTREPVTRPPPDGPGLRDHCASDICMRYSPLPELTIAEIRRLAAPGCRFTFATNVGATFAPHHVLDGFPEAAEIEICEPHKSTVAVVIELP